MSMQIMNNIKMQFYDSIDISEGIDVNKTSASKECDICLYWYFLNYSFTFQSNVCIDVIIYLWCLWTLAVLLF